MFFLHILITVLHKYTFYICIRVENSIHATFSELITDCEILKLTDESIWHI